MSTPSNFTLKTQVGFNFTDSEIRDHSFESYLPEVEKLNTHRSKLEMKKNGDLELIFMIECADITAFRATMSDIISFGKIIEQGIQLVGT